jgi:hypothetical protein
MEREMRRYFLFFFCVLLLPSVPVDGEETLFEKIDRAETSGTIGQSTALLYKLYAVKAPERLPEEYRSEAATPCATLPLLEVWRNLDILLRDRGKEVNPLLDRPAGLDSTMSSTHFKFHWTSAGTDSVARWYVESLAVYAESSWAYEVGGLGWDPPPADGDSGGDGLYDIYVFDIPISGVLGYVQTENIGPDPLQEDATSWMAYDCDVSPSYRRSTMAHEFNHACQFSYSYAEADFWYENTAVWAQDEVYDGENDYTGYLGMSTDNPLTRPEWSFDYFSGSLYCYGGVTWPKYLAEKNELDIVRRIWTLNGTHTGEHTIEDTDSILKSVYSDSFADAFKEYGVWRYFTGATRAQSPYYEEGSSWIASYVAPEHIHASYPASGDQGTRPPDYYGINYIEFDTTGLPGGLEISFDGEDGYYWGAVVIRYSNGGPSTFSSIDLDSNGAGSTILSWDSSHRLVLVPSVLSPSGSDVDYTYSATFMPSDTDTPVAQVVYPNGGESLSMATGDSITWIATDSVMVDSLSIYYSTDGGGSWIPVASGEANDSFYSWAVPSTPSSNCLVRISVWDWTEKWDEDTSDASFTIGDFTGPAVTVVRPNGGEVLGIGSTDSVRWNASDNVAVDSLSILYSIDAGSSWDTISTGEANDGMCPWSVPNRPSDSCLVRIIAFDPSLNQGLDISDGFFTIGDDVNPLVSVSFPNGGESFIPGTVDTIMWLAWDENGIDSVNIYYATDGGISWIDVAHGEANDSKYGWTIPDTPSDSCRVRIDVFDPAGNPGSDNSNGLFRILDSEPPTVTVVLPNGGEEWEIGETRQVTWVASDNKRVDSLSISYSYDNGLAWFTVSNGEPNDSVYDWVIPGPASDSCLIRITAFDFGELSCTDTSDAVFMITDTTAPVVSVLRPDGGEELEAGGVDTVAWVALDNFRVDSISIFYSSDGGAGWSPTASGEPNDSAYEWALPLTVSDSCLVRVIAYDAAGNGTPDQSESLFVISDRTAPSVLVLSPNGGEVLNSGEEDTIRWVASDLFGIDSVGLYLSTDNGGSWVVVSEGEMNDSSYVWTIPDQPSDSCLVRVSAHDPNGNIGSDASDSVFSIRAVGIGEVFLARRVPRALGIRLVNSNPFQRTAVLELGLPVSGDVRVGVYDVTGSLLETIFSGHLDRGYHVVQWDARGGTRDRLPAGVYFFRLESASGTALVKGTMLR